MAIRPTSADAIEGAAPRWDAFLSYSSRDAVVVTRVQRFLEGYRLPEGRRLRVYRDETDIAGGELPEQLRAALANSSSLLVCCSEAAAKSEWVAREIEAFRELSPERCILPVIVAGDPPQNLPASLRDAELRWSDLRSGWRFGRPRRKTRIELVRAVAAAAGEEFRDLLPLDRQRRRRNGMLTAGMTIAVMIATALRPVLSWQDVTPAGQPLFGCDTLDDGIAFYQHNEPQAIKNIVEVTRNALGPTPARHVVDNKLLPRGRLLPHFVDSAIHAHCRKSSPGWLGSPAPDVCVSISQSAAMGDFADSMGGGEASLTDVTTGARLFTLNQFWTAIDKRAWDAYGRSLTPSDGLPIAARGKDLWLGFPANKFTRGTLWHTRDGGVSWTVEKGITDVQSVSILSSGVTIAARNAGKLGFYVIRNGVFELLDMPGKGDRLEVCGEFEGEPVLRADRRAYRRLYQPWWRTWFS
jgi:hypothetical protein